MHSNFYEVRITKIDPVVTRAPPATGAGFGLLYFDWRIGGLRPFGPRAWPGSPCRCFFCYAGLRLQQTAEGEKPLTRQTLALLHRDS
jgi:hypothetical protein